MLLATSTLPAFSQKYFTKSGTISFFSKTSMENIDATSNQATSIIDATSGDIVFKVLQQSFQFQKALMQEHYNEKYVESEKFPEATFKGKIANVSAVNFTKDGIYPVKVTGDMTMHGATKSVTADGTITIKGGKVTAQAKFPLYLKDFKIEIPGAVKDKIAENVQVTVDISYAPLNK